MIVVSELRAGIVYEDQGSLLQVVSYEHIKMGRGSANIKVKVRNLRTGSTIEKSFINGAKVNDVHVIKKDMQYLYKDEESVYFMNSETYEQIVIPIAIIPEHTFLKEGEIYNISFMDEEAL